MLRTFDFIYRLQRRPEERAKVYSLMTQNENASCDLGGWHLSFDPAEKKVAVTSNGTDTWLDSKFIPARISYASLLELLQGSEDEDEDEDENDDLEIEYLE